MPHPPAALIFDMDETLAATPLLWRQAELRLLAEIGREWSPELAIQYKGMNVPDVAATIHRALQPTQPVIWCQDFLRRCLFEAYEKGDIQPMPGAVACVRSLALSYPLAVASGSPLPLIELAMMRLGLEECFTVLVSSESVPRGKPFPDIFLAAAKALGHAPAECLVFEDSLIGTQAAVAAGMACFTVPSSSPVEIAAIATRTFTSLQKVTPEDVASALG